MSNQHLEATRAVRMMVESIARDVARVGPDIPQDVVVSGVVASLIAADFTPHELRNLLAVALVRIVQELPPF